MVRLVVLGGAGEVLGLMREKGSEQERSQLPQNWKPVNNNNNNLFPSTQVFGSGVCKVTSG